MDPMQSWMLAAFVTVISAGLLLLDLGMRRTRRAEGQRRADGPRASLRHRGPA